jgi:WD40 repeat protein
MRPCGSGTRGPANRRARCTDTVVWYVGWRYPQTAAWQQAAARLAPIRVWETSTGRLRAALEGHAFGVYSVAISSTGHRVTSGGVDGTVRLWETSTGRLLARLKGHASGVYSVAMSAAGDVVASGGVDGTVRIWDVDTGQLCTYYASIVVMSGLISRV